MDRTQALRLPKILLLRDAAELRAVLREMLVETLRGAEPLAATGTER